MNADQMPLNVKIQVSDVNGIKNFATRIDVNTVVISWVNQEEEVLRIRSYLNSGLNIFESCDTDFWEITLNGNACTPATINNLLGKTPEVKVDCSKKSLSLKV
ncbi:MAG: hypothetical protein CMF23_17780 [Ignavibacteriae bacterium]|nr:hypothetical protein [Ignavibacteriota bacterium]